MKLKLEKTKLVDTYNRPVDFFHMTNVPEEIKCFHPLTHFGTKKAAEMRGLHFAYKILGIHEPDFLPEEFPEELKQQLEKEHPHYLKLYNVLLCLKSPLETVDFGKHDLGMYHHRFSSFYAPKSIYLTPKECMERDSVGSEKMTYKKLLSEFIFDAPKNLSVDQLKKELQAENLFESTNKTKEELIQNVASQRMIRYFESEGYDSFSYTNDCEDVGEKSYIIFRPEQVFQKGENEHEIPKISPENQEFLNQIEEDFFKDKGCIPPYQRKELNRQIRNKLFSKTK